MVQGKWQLWEQCRVLAIVLLQCTGPSTEFFLRRCSTVVVNIGLCSLYAMAAATTMVLMILMTCNGPEWTRRSFLPKDDVVLRGGACRSLVSARGAFVRPGTANDFGHVVSDGLSTTQNARGRAEMETTWAEKKGMRSYRIYRGCQRS